MVSTHAKPTACKNPMLKLVSAGGQSEGEEGDADGWAVLLPLPHLHPGPQALSAGE